MVRCRQRWFARLAGMAKRERGGQSFAAAIAVAATAATALVVAGTTADIAAIGVATAAAAY